MKLKLILNCMSCNFYDEPYSLSGKYFQVRSLFSASKCSDGWRYYAIYIAHKSWSRGFWELFIDKPI